MKIVLYIQNTLYGERLLRAMEKCQDGQCVFTLITKENLLMNEIESADLILSDLSAKEDCIVPWIYLTSDGCGERAIKKFMPGSYIYGEMMKMLDLCTPERVQASEVKKVVIYSPDAQSASRAALEMTQLLSARGSTVYMNLSGLPTLFDKEFPMGERGMSELLFGAPLEETSFLWENVRVVYPFCHFLDFLDVEDIELENLLNRLQSENGIVNFVIEMNQLSEKAFEIMELFDKVYLVGRNERVTNLKISKLQEYCQSEGRDKLLQRMVVKLDQ